MLSTLRLMLWVPCRPCTAGSSPSIPSTLGPMLSPPTKVLLLLVVNVVNVLYVLSHVRTVLFSQPASSPTEEYCKSLPT